jgi:D-lactate dehydrogenase
MMSDELVAWLRAIVGSRHVLCHESEIARYCTGFRFGRGSAVAVVRPASLVEQWLVVKACVTTNAIVVLQAANTGLTGGSAPNGDYDRPVVVVSTTRIKGLYLINDGRQAVCLPGTTLYELERALKPLKREPHSVIGSSCIGASVIGGICNNSGGALVQRGPAFTQLALYAQIGQDGTLQLVNRLGIRLGADPMAILDRLDRGLFDSADVANDDAGRASDGTYADHVRDIDAPTPARFNADPRCLFEASGSAGRLVVFAVRLDTFAAPERTSVFYIGTNDPDELTGLRRAMLANARFLPIAAEYIHRTAFKIATRYGKDTVAAIEFLGTDRLPGLFAFKSALDSLARGLGIREGFSDRLLQRLSKLLPNRLPPRVADYGERYEHHLLLKVADHGIEEARSHLAVQFPSSTGDFFECTAAEGEKAFLHRFAVAGAATRYRAVHREAVEDILALDIALPRNARTWFETLPRDIEAAILHKLYYGHFFCHVFHQDYVITKGRDPLVIEHRMWAILDKRGAEYPAEHNVGHTYAAKPALADFYRSLDPCNQLNPGIGKTSRLKRWEAKGSNL